MLKSKEGGAGEEGSGIKNFCYKTQSSKDLDDNDMLIKDVCLKTGATVIPDDLVLQMVQIISGLASHLY